VAETADLGATVGLLRAVDADIGENAEMEYRIISSDGPGMFDILTNKSTQEGIIAIRRVRKKERTNELKTTTKNVYVSFMSVRWAAMESDTRKEHVARIISTLFCAA